MKKYCATCRYSENGSVCDDCKSRLAIVEEIGLVSPTTPTNWEPMTSDKNVKMEDKKMKRVLWFSRHEMTKEQKEALGECEIVQVNRTINTAYELSDEIADCDIVAIVAPINLQQQFLKVAGDKPVIMAVNDRVLVPQPNGDETKVEFHFAKWERILKIDVIKEDFKCE